AKYIASLYLDDLADVVKQGLDPDFEFSRYGESLASSRSSFQPLENKLNSSLSLLDQMIQELLENYQESFQPELVGLTLPFPGNVYGGLRAAQILKRLNPQARIVMGGGYVNTELRKIEDPRIFKYTDFLIFDDGEMPLRRLISHLEGKSDESQLMRTMHLKNNIIQWADDPTAKDLPFKQSLTPDYSDLRLSEYVSMVEMPNPMHRMWSDFRWNKLILAHGCYWKKCAFCDVNLDYIGRFEPQKASQIVDHLEKMIKQTGSTGFHFVDEAGPPALLKQMSEEILRRGLKISWWGNLRFDSQFDEKLAELMADAGCVA
ncbi:MAG: B12-binding domain-containing radical SAM protein, partial [Bdellovibrionales bacterium]